MYVREEPRRKKGIDARLYLGSGGRPPRPRNPVDRWRPFLVYAFNRPNTTRTSSILGWLREETEREGEKAGMD